MEHLKMYIDGQWRDAISGQTREVLDPATGKAIAVAADGNEQDANLAVAAAKAAFYERGWWGTPAAERARLLFAVADRLEQRAEEFARLETLDCGKPIRESRIDVSDAAACFRYYAGLATKPHGQSYEVSDPMQSFVVREPIGVCAAIIPWNYPLLMAAWKLAPALAAGNSIVFKPSELTPMSAVRLFGIFEEVGFPPGVANLVLGPGDTVGHTLAAHHDVEKIAFTGGTATGRKIMQAASGNLKKISLELGGKSPNIVFADADFETAVEYAMFGIFANQGEVCAAGSRLLLEESVFERFLDRFLERTRKLVIGNGLDEKTEMGPLVSEHHLRKVLNYVEAGKKEGATLLYGGNRLTQGGLAEGYFMEPTVFVHTKPGMKIVQEEIFGPVLVVQTFRDEEEAIRLANDTVYGLAGAVFTTDGARAQRVVRRLRAGVTWINTYHPTYNEAPWGGYKQSGIGRELGTFGYESYTEVKQININLRPEPLGWYGSSI